MTEPTKEITPVAKPLVRAESLRDVVEQLVGKVVTMVNPESFEDATVGNRLVTGFYKAKVSFVGADYVEVLTELERKRGGERKEPVKQFIPLRMIKRVSLLKGERLIHI